MTALATQLDTQHTRDLERMLADALATNRRLVGERDALEREVASLRARLGVSVAVARRPPEITIYCDAPLCTTEPLVRDVAPPEDAIPGWVRGLDWTVEGDAYHCPRCSRAR